jgi:hypothetical protein
MIHLQKNVNTQDAWLLDVPEALAAAPGIFPGAAAKCLTPSGITGRRS